MDLRKMARAAPELDLLMTVEPDGGVGQVVGRGEPEALAQVARTWSTHLERISGLLGGGEVQAWAVAATGPGFLAQTTTHGLLVAAAKEVSDPVRGLHHLARITSEG
jgi:hypothetical protein